MNRQTGMVVFFDIDGTLLNQRDAERAAAVQFLRAFGDELPQPRTIEAFCRTWRALRDRHLEAWLNGQVTYAEYHRRRICDLFPGTTLSGPEADARFEVFHQAYRGAWSLYREVHRVLPKLAAHSLGVISNGYGPLQRQKLQDTGVLDFFSTVIISGDVGAAKPQEEIFVEACRQAGVSPADCIYVGDKVDSDIRPAQAAGMHAVWLNRNGQPGQHVPTVSTLAELPRLLNRYRRTVSGPRPPARPRRELVTRSVSKGRT